VTPELHSGGATSESSRGQLQPLRATPLASAGSVRPPTDAFPLPSHHLWSASIGSRVRWLFPLPPWPCPSPDRPSRLLPSTASPWLLQLCKHRCSRPRSAACVTFTRARDCRLSLDRLRSFSLAVRLDHPSSSAPDRVHSRSALPPSFGPTVPPARSRSVLVVSHHLDGLLHCLIPGLVASRSRPWGPPRFQRRPSFLVMLALTGMGLAGTTWREPRDALHTLQRFPLPGSRILSPGPLPSCRWLPRDPLPFVPSCDRRPFQTLLPLLLDSRALLHRRVRCTCSPWPVRLRSFLSWALFHFKASLPFLAVRVRSWSDPRSHEGCSDRRPG